MLINSFVPCNRGFTCSIQSEFMVRVGDLKVVPCHRTEYSQFIYGELIDDEKEILKFKVEKPELLITIFGMHRRDMMYCSMCPINHLCGG